MSLNAFGLPRSIGYLTTTRLVRELAEVAKLLAAGSGDQAALQRKRQALLEEQERRANGGKRKVSPTEIHRRERRRAERSS